MIPVVWTVVVGATVEAAIIWAFIHTPWSRWLPWTCFLIVTPFCFLGVGVLVGGGVHLTDPLWQLTVEFGA